LASAAERRIGDIRGRGLTATNDEEKSLVSAEK